MGPTAAMSEPVVVSTAGRPSSGGPAPTAARRWWSSPLALSLVGQALLWAAMPPLDLAPLAWLAPVPWIVLIRRGELAGRRPYKALWFSSFLFWLAAVYWVTLPHWATSFGWVALAFYLAFYFPIFIGLARVAATLGISPIISAPAVWTGLELVRAHMLTGFTMASLSHTQYRWPEILQVSDLFGAYGVSFVIMLAAACLGRMLPCDGARRSWWPLLPLTAVLASALAYGRWRTMEDMTRPGPNVALIQGSIDIDMKYDPKQSQVIYDEYMALSRRAIAEHPNLDLIVWPETMFPYPWWTFDKDFKAPIDATITPEEFQARSHRAIENTVRSLDVPCLLGIATIHQITEDESQRYNSALFVERDGRAAARYDKCHLVPFGEYVFFAETFPWLYQLTPLPGGLNRGAGPISIDVGSARCAPDICYENTIGHLIRSQVAQLQEEGREPDLLVTLTNDGWFWGSTELDMHLACGVFRAIECRKSMLIAANTGFSAWIDSDGRIQSQGRRRQTDVIVAATRIDTRDSWYVHHGDTPAGACLAFSCALGLVGTARFVSRRKSLKNNKLRHAIDAPADNRNPA